MKPPSEVIQDIRQCSLGQVKAELDALRLLAKTKPEYVHIANYDTIVSFFERAKLRPKSE